MKRAIVLLGCVALLTSCVTTTADLRDRPPRRSATLPGDYRQLAGCVMDGLETDDGTARASYRLLELADRQRASIIGTVPMSWATAAIFEATFAQRADQVEVETRTAMLRAGIGIDARAWPIIERCAGAASRDGRE